MVTVQVSDGTMEIAKEICDMSKLMKEMMSEGDDNDIIPLPNVKQETMIKVVEWCNYHQSHPLPEVQKPIASPDVKVVLKDFPWDAEFINIDDQETVFNLVLAANYLDIEPLLDLGCMRIACWLKNKKPEEVRSFFNITQPSPEEEERIRKEKFVHFEHFLISEKN